MFRSAPDSHLIKQTMLNGMKLCILTTTRNKFYFTSSLVGTDLFKPVKEKITSLDQVTLRKKLSEVT